MNTDSGKTTITHGDVLRRAEGMQRLSVRSQGKTYWRACRFLGMFDLPYPRMRELLFLGANPANPDEASFKEGWSEYFGRIQAGQGIEVSEETPLHDFLQEAIQAAEPADDIAFLARLNGLLLASGLWPIYLRNSDEEAFAKALEGDAEALGSLLLKTPLQETEYIDSLRPLSDGEIGGWIREDVLPMDRVSKVFLMGSFHRGDPLPDSDVDLGIVFESGLTESEKREALSSICSSCLAALARKADACELFALPDGNPPFPQGHEGREVLP